MPADVLDKVSLEFIKKVFDVTKFKGCSLTSEPTGFRTNGNTVHDIGLAGESSKACTVKG